LFIKLNLDVIAKEMLQMHPKKGAVIFLKDVQFSVLVALVEVNCYYF